MSEPSVPVGTEHLPPHRPWRFDPASAVICERDGQSWPCAAAMAGGWKQERPAADAGQRAVEGDR